MDDKKDEILSEEAFRELSDEAFQQLEQAAKQMGVVVPFTQEEMFQHQKELFKQKDVLARYKQRAEVISNLLSSGFKVVTGPTKEEAARQLLQIVEHAEGLWKDAKLLFSEGRYATACFLSIACIEECAKLDLGWFQAMSFFVKKPEDSVKDSQALANSRRKMRSMLTSHVRKQLLGACAGALVNSRMDRVLGMDRVASFISDCEKGQIEKLRQSCLYVDIDQGRRQVLLPMERISKEQALFYVCLAGEILAQVLCWERLLTEVDKFEKDNGVTPSTFA